MKKFLSVVMVFMLVMGFSFSMSLAKEETPTYPTGTVEVLETSGTIPIVLEGTDTPTTRSIPNHIRFAAKFNSPNQAVASVTNIGIDTVDRVRVKATVYHTNGTISGTPTYNEYKILPLFYRTFYYNYTSTGKIIYDVEVWDGGDYGYGRYQLTR